MKNLLTPLRSRSAILAGLCLVVVALGDSLLYGHARGANIPLVAGVLLLLLSVRRLHDPQPIVQLTAFPVLLGLLAAQVHHTSLLATIMTVFGLIVLSLGLRHGWTADVTIWVQRCLRFIPSALSQPFRDRALANRWRNRHPRFLQITQLMVVRFCFPLVLGAVFVSLFGLANPVLANWLIHWFTALWDFLSWLIAFPPFTRLLLWAGIFLFAWALCRTRGHHRPPHRRTTPPSLPPPVLPRLSFPPPPPSLHAAPAIPPEPLLTSRLLMSCLLLFNVLFAVQNLLDTRYLWGGATLPQGLTWAQYAHRGAYPLIVTALLAAVFILWAFHPTSRAGDAASARRLLVLWVAQNVFLTLSAVWRLNLYVQVYSLTLWRVAAGIWMFLVMAGLIWILWRILRNRGNAWLVNANVYTLAIVLYLCCFVDWAGFIAAYNIRHCRETSGGGQELDALYIQSLGSGTLPALYAARRPSTRTDAAVLRRKLDRTIAALEPQLRDETRGWRGWTLQRQHSLNAGCTDAALRRERGPQR